MCVVRALAPPPFILNIKIHSSSACSRKNYVIQMYLAVL